MKKVTLKPNRPQTVFFPSPDEFVEFMGGKVSARSKVMLFEKACDVKVDISKRSLDNLSTVGISKKLAVKTTWPFMRYLRNLGVFPILKQLDNQKYKIDVYPSWKAALDWMDFHYKGEVDLSLIYRFFKDREESYVPLKKHILSSELMEDNCKELLFEYVKISLPKTRLTINEQEVVLSVFEVGDYDNLSESANDAVLKWCFDFHVSLIAVFDLTLLHHIQQQDNVPSGVMSNIFASKGKTYFGKLIEYVACLGNTSKYRLAELVPIDREASSSSGVTLDEAQRSTLKDWCSGKTKPTFNTLCDFFEPLMAEGQSFPMVCYAMLCIALDKQKEAKQTDADTKSFVNVFSEENYSDYFIHYRSVFLPESDSIAS